MLLYFIYLLFVATHIIIGTYDFSFYRIPNLFLGFLLVLYGCYAPIYLEGGDILNSVVVFAVVLVLGFGLYAFKFIGGGDAKYIAVASLWVSVHGALEFIFYVSLFGGGLALAYLLLNNHIARLSDLMWLQIQKMEKYYPRLQYVWLGSGEGPELGKRENVEVRAIPYGVAIAAASILMMLK